MIWRVIYQGIMIGALTLIAFCIGLATPNIEGTKEYVEHVKIEIGQTMAFSVLALSQLVHVFNIRDNKNSIFKTKPFNNKKLIIAIAVSALLMITILLIPTLRQIFSIWALPTENIIEVICLVFAPIVIVEIFKLLKINTTKEEQ